jgi:pyruvate,water dikinase
MLFDAVRRCYASLFTDRASCAEGDDGFVYRGRLPIRVERTNLADLSRPRTQMMMNVANPAEAFSLSFLSNDGVGLARLEFIISTHVRAHPMALLHPERIADSKQRREIERLTAGYADKGEYFVDRLAEGVAMIAAAFWPKDSISLNPDSVLKTMVAIVEAEKGTLPIGSRAMAETRR